MTNVNESHSSLIARVEALQDAIEIEAFDLEDAAAELARDIDAGFCGQFCDEELSELDKMSARISTLWKRIARIEDYSVQNFGSIVISE